MKFAVAWKVLNHNASPSRKASFFPSSSDNGLTCQTRFKSGQILQQLPPLRREDGKQK